jgi:IclR family acetate operon transcriptional repressor
MDQESADPRAGLGLVLLDRAFQILELLDAERPALTQAEIMRQTGLPKSTVSRLVRYLSARGYLVNVEPRGAYGLGPAAMELGRRALAHFDLREAAAPHLDRLSQMTGETVILTTYDQLTQHVVCVDQIPSRHGGLQVFERVGSAFPLHAGAVAKAVLAFLSPAQRDKILRGILPAITSHTITDKLALDRDLALSFERGYAISREETYIGVNGVAVPIFGAAGRLLGSAAVAGPVHRMPEDALTQYGQLLRHEMGQLSARLGATSSGDWGSFAYRSQPVGTRATRRGGRRVAGGRHEDDYDDLQISGPEIQRTV